MWEEGTGPTAGVDELVYSNNGTNFNSLTSAAWTVRTGTNFYFTADFGTGSSNITAGQIYLASNLGTTVNPVFQGGTLQTDQSNGSYAQNFTLDGSGTNTIDQTGKSSTFSGVFSDASPGTPGSIIIANSGVGGSVTFTGVSTYTGSTTINTGATLALSGLGSIATSSGVAANGTFDISQTTLGASIAGLSGSGVVALGGEALTLTGASGTFSGVISDGGIGGGAGGSLIVAGGTQTLTGVNTYTGSTTINTGATLALSGLGSIATSSGVAANGTFDISQATSGASIASLSGSGVGDLGGKTLTLSGASGTFSGVIADGGVGGGTAGSLILAGGTETLTGVNTYTGSTTINSGATLALAGSGSIASSSVAANGTFDISQSFGASIASLSGSGAVVLGNETLTLTGANGAFSGAISDGATGGGPGGSLVVAGGTETLSGANTYTGLTTVNTGATLALAGSGSIATSSGVAANGRFDISQTISGATITNLSGSGSVALGAQSLTLTSATGTFSGVISDPGIGSGTGGSLIVTAGEETLTGVNTYTGSTTINGYATLALGGSGSIGASAGVLADGVLDISQTTNGASIASLSGSGFVDLGSQTLTLAGANGTFLGQILDGGLSGGTGGSLVLAGGTETLTNANTYTGSTTINTGATLALSGLGSIMTSSGVVANGTFDVSQTTTYALITSLSGSGVVALGGRSLTLLGANGTFSGVISDGGIGNGTGGSLLLEGGAETLTGISTYTGYTYVGAGTTLALAGSGSIATSSALADYGTFDISRTASGASIADLYGSGVVALGGQTLTLTNAVDAFVGEISDGGVGGGTGGGLIIAGGTETLLGANIYTGSTTINFGATLALLEAGSIAASSGVTANGTLDISQTNSGASIVSLSGSGAVALGSRVLTLTGANGTFSGVIADGGVSGGPAGSLTVAGGTETLTGVNTYTGSTTINPGATLALGATGSIAASYGVTANGTFDISQTTSGASISGLSGSGTVALGSQALTLSGVGVFSGVIADSGIGGGTGGSLILAGGRETLAGQNAYTGATTIDSGAVLALAGPGSIAVSSAVTANGLFDISQTTAGASITTLSGSGIVVLGGQALTLTAANGTFSGEIADIVFSSGAGGGLIIAGGIETLTNSNTYTGSTTINSGATLALAGSGSIASSSVIANGTLDVSQMGPTASIGSLSGAGALDLGGQDLVLTNASGTFSGVVSNRGIINGVGGGLMLDAGTETLTGVNTYSGASTINRGATLALSGSGSVASSVVDALGTFDISQTTSGASITSLSGTGVAALGGQVLTVTGGIGTFFGVIADGGIGGGTGGSLVIAGGTEGLDGVNSYTGATTINSGATLGLYGIGSIATSSGVTANGTLDISYATSGASIATLSGSGGVALGSQTLTLTNASGTFSGVIADGGIGGGKGGGLTVAGGTETLTGANTYTGATTINSGATLALVGAGSIASSAVTANGTFDISHTTSGASVVSLSGSGVVDLGGQTLTLDTQNGIFTGVISDSGVGSNTVGTVVLATGTQVLTGANTYTGNTAIAAGSILQVGNGGTTGSIAGNVADDGTLVFDRADNFTYSGVVFGTGALTQVGAGTTLLNGVNTITGVTTVQAGVLEVGDASHASASLAGAVVVGAAGTLRGHGSIAGSVTNTAGGTVAPGGTIGTLTVGSYTQGANSTLAIEVSPTGASQLNVLGAASLNGKLALTFDPGIYASHTYQIISAASLTGTFSSITEGGSVPGGGLVYALSYGARQADLFVESTGGAQIYGGIGTATLDEARGFASLVADRSGDAGCADGSAATTGRDCKMGAWAQAIASTDNVGAATTGFGFNNTGAGAMGGLDRRVGDNATVGVAFGFEQNDLRMGGASATASGSSYYGAVYAHWIVGPAWIDGQGFYMRSNWTVNRGVAGSSAVTSSPNGGTKGFLVQASAPVGGGFRPYARFTYANFDRDGVTETGLNGAGYVLPLASSRTALAEAGLQWSHNWLAPGGVELRPALEMGVQNDLADQNRDVIGSLEGIAGTGFTVSSVHLPPTAGVADASLKVRVTNRFELTADLRDRFSANQTDASASLGGLFHF